jgi:sulfite reductase (ferredoxin)
MLSFTSELDNPIVTQDILDLERRIRQFRDGKVSDEKFRSVRLARGIYGQRQPGVQMVRIKMPYGKMTFKQWKRVADISDEYATSNLHLTTRQDIQIHYVSLDRTPELWSKLELDKITIREACSNTVRNVTASDRAGIDPEEPFDVTPYADAAFRYFLRNPVTQEMGRKIKFGFSSSERDTDWSFINDFGMIPKVKIVDGKEVRGFKVLVGGSLGAQPFLGVPVFDFLETDKLIPYIENVLRVFDRYGERTNRNKARMKFLIQKIGLDEFKRLIEEEYIAIKVKSVPVDAAAWPETQPPAPNPVLPAYTIKNPAGYEAWKLTNTFEQKQAGYFGAYVKITLGNISSDKSRQLIEALRPVVADDVRITVNQGLLFKYILPEHLPYIYSVLEEVGFADAGFDSVSDITACPGTDTCNLGISNSTSVAKVLESVIKDEYPDLIYNKDIKIKISGCMNSCGQHGVASIGFHGSSMKAAGKVLPAVQVLLGGGIVGDGAGRVSDKVIKVPSRRAPEVLRTLLNDYDQNSQENELFNEYYDRQGEKYFYTLLKPLTDLTTLTPGDFVDWGQAQDYATAIGVGECAGVILDLVSTLLLEAEEKLELASAAILRGAFSDGIYYAYSSFVQGAKALLLGESLSGNTQIGIINDFDKHFVATGKFSFGDSDFKTQVLLINTSEPTESFANAYFRDAQSFYNQAQAFRQQTSEPVQA